MRFNFHGCDAFAYVCCYEEKERSGAVCDDVLTIECVRDDCKASPGRLLFDASVCICTKKEQIMYTFSSFSGIRTLAC